MPRITHAGYLLPGISRAVDRAGWQCQAADHNRDRCRLIATHTHRRRDGDRTRTVALCPAHYQLAGPEAR